MNLTRQRKWLSPLTAVTFLAIGVTGVLMFFHVRSGTINVLHEMAGLLFVLVGALHLAANWTALVGYLRLRAGRVALGVGIALCVALIAMGSGHEERHGRGPASAQARD